MSDQETDDDKAKNTPEPMLDNEDLIVIDHQQLQAEENVAGKIPVSASDIENLTAIVLDAAGAANKAANSANKSIRMLLDSVEKVTEIAQDFHKTNGYMLGAICILGVVGLLSGAVMLYVLQSAVKDAVAVNLAMGAKLVQFEKQMDRVHVLEDQLIDVADVNVQLGQSVEQAMYSIKAVGADTAKAAAQQLAENQLLLGSVNDQVLTSFDDLQDTAKAQQGVLTQLQQRIDGLQLQMKKTQSQDLVGKMKALIALEQGRYFELEQKKLALETAKFEAKKKIKREPLADTYITFGVTSK